MTHDPEEIKAVAEKIGKLYGYNVEAIARNVLDVLRPFRDREILLGGARHHNVIADQLADIEAARK